MESNKPNCLILDDFQFIHPGNSLSNSSSHSSYSSSKFTAEQYQSYKNSNPFQQYMPEKKQFVNFDQKEKWKLKDQKHQKCLNDLLAVYDNHVHGTEKFVQSVQYLKQTQKYLDVLNLYQKENNPKISFLLGYYKYIKGNLEKMEDSIKVAADQGYPLALFFLAQQQKNQKEKLKYLNKAAEYGDKYALFSLGQLYFKKQKINQAFNNFYYSGERGLQLGWRKISEFYEKGIGRAPNLKFALKYAKKYAQLQKQQFILDVQINPMINRIENTLNQYQNFQKQLISTNLHQAQYVLNFLKHRQDQLIRRSNSKLNEITNTWTQNTQTLSHFQNSVQKIFYIILPTYTIFPSRGFLGEDQNGVIEMIYIYNWNQMPLQKYRLLFQLGTKITLNHYIRKLGANDQLPMYRIQNPQWVKIEPRTQKHYLKNSKIRQLCKQLFKNGWYQQCIKLYDFIIDRKGEEQDIVYSNKAECLIKLQKFEQAIKSVQKSLKINPKNQKSIFRISDCYYNLNNYLKAKQYAITLSQSADKNSLLKKIEAKLLQHQNSMNLSLQKYKKVQKGRQKSVIVLQNLKKKGLTFVPSQMGDYFKVLIAIIQVPLKMDKLTWPQKQSYTKKLIQAPLTAQISLKNLEIIKNSLKMTYEMIDFYYTKSQKVPILDSIQCYSFYQNNNLYEIFQNAMKGQKSQQLNKVCNDYEFDLIFKLCIRATILQDKIQNACILAQKNQNYELALNLYQCGIPKNINFSKNYSDLLIKANSHEKNIQFCQNMMSIINEKINKFYSYWHYTYFKLNQIKSLIQLKHQKVLQEAKTLYQFIQDNSSDLTYQKYEKALLTEKTDIVMDSKQMQKNKKNAQSKFGSLKKIFVELSKIISLQYFNKKLYKQSLDFINIAILKDVQSGFQLQVHKSRVLLKLDMNEQALQLIEINLNKLKTGTIVNRDIYKNAFYKLKMQTLINLKQYKAFVQFSRDIVKLDCNNLNFIQNKISFIAKNNEEQLHTIVQILKDYQLLQIIYQKFKIYLRAIQIQKDSKILETKKDIQEINKLHELYQLQDDEQYQTINHKQLSIYYKNLKSEIDSKNQQETAWDQIQELKLLQNLENQFKGFQSIFYHQKQLYIVIFQQTLHIQKKQLQRFKLAAGKGFCKKFYGSNGIKILNQEFVELKINSGVRLVGKIFNQKNRKLVVFDSINTHLQVKKKI